MYVCVNAIKFNIFGLTLQGILALSYTTHDFLLEFTVIVIPPLSVRCVQVCLCATVCVCMLQCVFACYSVCTYDRVCVCAGLILQTILQLCLDKVTQVQILTVLTSEGWY